LRCHGEVSVGYLEVTVDGDGVSGFEGIGVGGGGVVDGEEEEGVGDVGGPGIVGGLRSGSVSFESGGSTIGVIGAGEGF